MTDKKTKIALSASLSRCPKVRDLLHECSYIYTSRADAYPSLCEEFGTCKILVVQGFLHLDEMQDLILRVNGLERSEVTFLTFSDLAAAHREWAATASHAELETWADYCGWSLVGGEWLNGSGIGRTYEQAMELIRKSMTGR